MAALESLGPESSFFTKDLVTVLPFVKTSIKLENGIPKWRWDKQGQFTCASAYRAMHHSGFISPFHGELWKTKVLMKVRIFIWLMLDNKILTQEVLFHRGCIVPTGCHFCGDIAMESKDHIMWDYIYARRFWFSITAQFNFNMDGAEDILRAWTQVNMDSARSVRVLWNVVWVAGAWSLWRERNIRLFSNKTRMVQRLLEDTNLEIEKWRSSV